jgi:transposase
MFALSAATRIYFYTAPCDMRKSFDGLCGLVRTELDADPLSGSLFVFVNRRRNMVKLLYWASDGFAIWFRGCFNLPAITTSDALIDRRQLSMLLEGVVAKKVSKRYVVE